MVKLCSESVKAKKNVTLKTLEVCLIRAKNYKIKNAGVLNMNEQFPDFTGKSVVFYFMTNAGMPDWMNEGIVLDSPTFQMQGNRLFVVGQTPDAPGTDESFWSANRQAALAWEAVFHYVVLPIEEYREIHDNELDAEPIG